MRQRTPQDLRDQSVHVLWAVRQLVALSAHLERRARAGVSILHEPLDAASLEAFALHARALTEFLWRDRTGEHGKRPGATYAVAADWFPNGRWNEMDRVPLLPADLKAATSRASIGVAHLAYGRLRPQEAWEWDHVGIAEQITRRFARFVDDADPALLASGLQADMDELLIAWRSGRPFEWQRASTASATAAAAGTWKSLTTPGP